MPVNINDRIMVYILFVTLAVLSLFTVTGNRAAKDAAVDAKKAATTAVIKAEAAVKAATEARDGIINKELDDSHQANSHRIRNEAEHECLLTIFTGGGADLATRFKNCVLAESPGTVNPHPLPGQEE